MTIGNAITWSISWIAIAGNYITGHFGTKPIPSKPGHDQQKIVNASRLTLEDIKNWNRVNKLILSKNKKPKKRKTLFKEIRSAIQVQNHEETDK